MNCLLIYRRIAAVKEKAAENVNRPTVNMEGTKEDQIQARLMKLKEDNVVRVTSDEEIAKRLQAIKGVKSSSDADISTRLAKLGGAPVIIKQVVKSYRTD